MAGAMFARCKNWLFEDCEWGFISIGKPGAVSGDGEAFDFESNCDRMVMRNCLFHDTDGPGFLLCCYASGPEPERDIRFENCVFSGKAARAGENRTPRVEIFNTTDLNEVTWQKCKFYLAPGVALYATMDITVPGKPLNNLRFADCVIKHLSQVARSAPIPAKAGHLEKFAAEQEPGVPWTAAVDEGYWVELDFGGPKVISEFKLGEEPGSAVSRYVIETWDDAKSEWVSCFNGGAIGAEFIAPIVSRNVSKARVSVLRTNAGAPRIASFEAFNDSSGEIYTAVTGGTPSVHMGK